MQFSRNIMQFWQFQPFLGQFQQVGYKKVCTQAEKFIGGTGICLRPPQGAEGHNSNAEGLQRGPKAPQQPTARAGLFGATRQNILVM